MPRKFIDLSVPIEIGIKSDPPGYESDIKYSGHDDTASEIIKFFPGLKAEDLPDSKGWAYDEPLYCPNRGAHSQCGRS